jgi:hypothetical protein
MQQLYHVLVFIELVLFSHPNHAQKGNGDIGGISRHQVFHHASRQTGIYLFLLLMYTFSSLLGQVAMEAKGKIFFKSQQSQSPSC